MKTRRSGDGLLLFDRNTGLNILFDEMKIPSSQWSRAPRFVSFALTNLCDLHCPFCYAPKQTASLDFRDLVSWAKELDQHDCIGVGFGGGEPTLYPRFPELCNVLTQSTQLSVSFTTHGHRFSTKLRDQLVGGVHFIRVSMDGVRGTYEQIRNRRFCEFLNQLKIIKDTSPFGINFVVRDTTITDLDEAADLAFEEGAKELLLLPERSSTGLQERTLQKLREWISTTSSSIRLSISESQMIDGIPLANPFLKEKSLQSYIHVNAFGNVSQTSFHQRNSVNIKKSEGILAAIAEYEGGQ